MSGFLDEMARSSLERVEQAMRRESYVALEQRAGQAAPSAPLKLSAGGFDVIAELKLRSPATGRLGAAADDWRKRIADYARGGAAAVSVLTEPSRFDGSLEHLRQAASTLAPFGIPAMRKDFLVHPYQLLEARAAGAGGALVILRMLSRDRITEMMDAAATHRMFVLLEAFDVDDLCLARELMTRRGASSEMVLIGINCRDLQTLRVVPERFAELAPALPSKWPAVAESGVACVADARRMLQLGYRLALIGTALMSRDDPAELLREIFSATRTVQG